MIWSLVPITLLLCLLSASVALGEEKPVYQIALDEERELRVYSRELPPLSENGIEAAETHPNVIVRPPDRRFEFRYVLVSQESDTELWRAGDAWFPGRPDWGAHRLLGAALIRKTHLAIVFQQSPNVWVHFIPIRPDTSDKLPTQPHKLMQLSDVNGPVIRSATIRDSLDGALIVSLMTAKAEHVDYVMSVADDHAVTWVRINKADGSPSTAPSGRE